MEGQLFLGHLHHLRYLRFLLFKPKPMNQQKITEGTEMEGQLFLRHLRYLRFLRFHLFNPKRIMKNCFSKLAVVTALMAATAAPGAVFPFNSTGSTTIPDYPGSGSAAQFTFNASDYTSIESIAVTFTTVGGWNGDLYAYVSHGSGLAILLNRVGAGTGNPDGYGTSGFSSITLSSLATSDIHGIASPTTFGGPYAADGRLSYTDTGRPNTLSVFNNVDPNGAWTVYFADMAALNTSTLTSWNVSITAVPEPVNVALAIFALLFAAAIAVARLRKIRNPKSEIRKQDC